MKRNSVLSKNEYIAMSQPERYTHGPEINDENQSVHRHLTTKIVGNLSECSIHCS